jgi:phosphate transport system substrate-binding protein
MGRTWWFGAALLMAGLGPLAQGRGEAAQDTRETAQGARDSMAVQAARSKSIDQFANKKYYDPRHFDLSDLPSYVPEQKITGPIRIWGSDMFGGVELKRNLQAGFRKYHPDASFEFDLRGPALAFAGLLTEQADLGPSRRITWDALLAFQRLFNHDPLVISGMTGWAVNPPFAIMVNKNNPLRGLTMQQLDGIFGAARNGGWVGTEWHPEFARGASDNIRTWGQLGLAGKWRNRPIHVYGYGLRYLFGPRFSDDVLKGSDKWNENLQQYVNFAQADGTLKSADQQMADELAKDPYGIAYYAPLRGASDRTKAVPLAASEGGPYVALSVDTVRDRAYPLYDQMYIYINRRPAEPLNPKVKEFMRYILSREGQQEIARDTTMLPLTAAEIRVQLAKLD